MENRFLRYGVVCNWTKSLVNGFIDPKAIQSLNITANKVYISD